MIIHIPDNCTIPLKSFVDFVDRFGYQVVSKGTELHLVESPPNPNGWLVTILMSRSIPAPCLFNRATMSYSQFIINLNLISQFGRSGQPV